MVSAGLTRLGEVVALEKLVAGNLVVVSRVAGLMVFVGSGAMVLGYQGRRESAVLEAGERQPCATCNAGFLARARHGLGAL